MIETIKNFYISLTADKDIKENNFEAALSKLNMLIKQDFRPENTYLKRARLCHKLLMFDNAYSDYTYVITHDKHNTEAIFERMNLNYEMGNYSEAVIDASMVLENSPANAECIRIKFNSYVLSSRKESAKNYITNIFNSNKYKAIQYIFTETAKFIAENELAKALKLLEIVDMIDKDNPLKIFNEANIYSIAGDSAKETELMNKLDTIFPKYFVSHFRFGDMYEERDIYEISFLLELKLFDKIDTFAYPMSILEGYKYHIEGHISDSKEAFERAIKINPQKPEAYVLLGQTLQLMSGYDNPAYKKEAEDNYTKAMMIYEQQRLISKAEDMRRQIKHLNSNLSFR